jgi:hypothetical protein
MEKDQDDAAARYFEIAEQFLADDEMDAKEAAVAASFLDVIGIAAFVDEDAEMSEEVEDLPQWGGSRPGKSPNKKRDFMGAHTKLVEHYFLATRVCTMRPTLNDVFACQELFSIASLRHWCKRKCIRLSKNTVP